LSEISRALERARAVLQKPVPGLEPEVLRAYVAGLLDRRERFLSCCAPSRTPAWVFDEEVLRERARRFTAAFAGEVPGFQAFFAMKSNNHPSVSRSLVRAGLGLDVSSGLELQAALAAGCGRILFSGPGKTDEELELALRHRDRVTVLMDSFGELERLEKAAGCRKVRVRAGVRLTTEEQGLWRKFGIPLGDLEGFFDRAARSRQVSLRGLQFHTSWNLGPAAQVRFLGRLGRTLASCGLGKPGALDFLDIGGGYWPRWGEWVHLSATPKGRLLQTLFPGRRQGQHCRLPSQPIEVFAREIGAALRRHIFPHVQCRVFAEPGRWLVNDCLHLLLTVIDKKAGDVVIVNAGTNNVGWERFETDYVPVLNLSRPSLRERRCFLFGSLCTPHDVWGYGYFGEGIEPGDVLLIPDQGAYTYSLRQRFIKPLARTVRLGNPAARRAAVPRPT